MSVQNFPAIELPFLYCNGFTPVYVSTTTFTLSAGQCRDSNNAMDIVIGTKPVTGPTVGAPLLVSLAVTGINGVDNGTVTASSVYAIYVIADSTYKQNPGALLSLASNVSPKMPFGYDSYRLLGYIAVDGSSHFINTTFFGVNNDRSCVFVSAQSVLSGGTSTSAAFVDCSHFIPVLPAATMVSMKSVYIPGTAGHTLAVQNDIVTGQVATVHVTTDSFVPTVINTGAIGVAYSVTSGDSVSLLVSGFNYSV